MSLGIGQGSETQQPIGVVTIFGLSISMFFTLFFVPVMYTFVDDIGALFRRLFRKGNRVVPETGASGNQMES